NVPVGVYTVSASADGYYPGSQTVAVEEDKVASARFELVSTATKRTALSGKVSDKATGKALAGTVSFPEAGLASVATDPATGVYMTEIAPGSYAIKAAAEGYIDQAAAIIIEEGKPQIRNFELVKEGMSITLRGVYFDFDKSTIKPESHAALADAAKILTDNPTIRVEIQGHTDSRGSDSYNLDLSDRRSWSVVNYLVQNLGIDRGRLTARGYGEARPIDTNDTDAGRAMNRRVEFVILSK
ncbi:MAG: OmpA family protein, partial [bacterium]